MKHYCNDVVTGAMGHEYQTDVSENFNSSIRIFVHIYQQLQDLKTLEAIRSRRHVQTQVNPINSSTILLGPEIQHVASQQVKNLGERD